MSGQYDYDPHGNMTRMPHLPLMRWDYRDQLQASSQQVVTNGGTPETTYYVYDAAGQRIRKVTERFQPDPNQEPTRSGERIYIGGFEVFREYNGSGSTVTLERETLHVMDDQQRIAQIDTRTQGSDDAPAQSRRFQLSNHLGSAIVEVDEEANVISYEEYHPYGTTAYRAGRSAAEVSLKRYRYTGKERDEETGLYYHGGRYYACWLGRWTAADPIGLGDGVNRYVYTRGQPSSSNDPTGTVTRNPDTATISSRQKLARFAKVIKKAAKVAGEVAFTAWTYFHEGKPRTLRKRPANIEEATRRTSHKPPKGASPPSPPKGGPFSTVTRGTDTILKDWEATWQKVEDKILKNPEDRTPSVGAEEAPAGRGQQDTSRSTKPSGARHKIDVQPKVRGYMSALTSKFGAIKGVKIKGNIWVSAAVAVGAAAATYLTSQEASASERAMEAGVAAHDALNPAAETTKAAVSGDWERIPEAAAQDISDIAVPAYERVKWGFETWIDLNREYNPVVRYLYEPGIRKVLAD